MKGEAQNTQSKGQYQGIGSDPGSQSREQEEKEQFAQQN